MRQAVHASRPEDEPTCFRKPATTISEQIWDLRSDYPHEFHRVRQSSLLGVLCELCGSPGCPTLVPCRRGPETGSQKRLSNLEPVQRSVRRLFLMVSWISVAFQALGNASRPPVCFSPELPVAMPALGSVTSNSRLPLAFEPANSAADESSADISADGLMLVFSSNRPGGYGNEHRGYKEQSYL